jgi:hypothetical protein
VNGYGKWTGNMFRENIVYSGVDGRDGSTHYYYTISGINISTVISNDASIDLNVAVGIDTDKYIKHIISRAPSRVEHSGDYNLKVICDYHGNITSILEQLKR